MLSKISVIFRKSFRINRQLVKKVLAIGLSGILLILLLLGILFQFNKDKIASSLLLKVNEYQNGELVFDDLSFNPFIHFPDVSIVLYDIQYYQEKRSQPSADTIPILRLENLYIGFNLLDLLKGEVNVPNIHLENGRLNLLTDDGGTLNLMKALKKNKVAVPVDGEHKKKTVTPDSLKQKKPETNKKVKDKKNTEPPVELILDLENIYVKDIDVSYINHKENISSEYQLQSLQASLQYLPDSIICALDTKLLLVNAYIANNYRVDSIQIGLTTRLNLDDSFENIRIEPSQLEIDKASFLANGTVSMKGEGAINMDVKGNDEDFGILNLIFTNIGIDNIEKGDMYFDASIKGPLFKGIPRIKLSFGINDLQINIPSTSQKVSNLKMRANFDSGELEKLEGASFQLNELSATLPRGKLFGKMAFSNFQAPKIDVDFFVKSEISGFEKLIKFGNLERMAGILELKTKFKGDFDIERKVWSKEEDYSHIVFKEVSFSKTATKTIDGINGKISLQQDELALDSINIVIDDTNLLLTGSVSNLKLLLAKLYSPKVLINSIGGIYFSLDTALTSQINIEIGLTSNLNDLMPFLPINSLDTLGGNIDLTSNYSGSIDWETDLWESISGQSSIEFNDVAIDIPKINQIRIINGSVLVSNSMTYFHNLSLEYGKSDAIINGDLSNLSYLFLNGNKPIEGNLLINSNVFDYPDVFSYDSYIASAFPYRIKNIELIVAPKTTTNNLKTFKQTPRLEFNIRQLDAEIEDFLPPISIANGYFLLSDKVGGVNLDFNNFNIDVLDGKVKANVEIQTSVKSSNWLKVQGDFINVNLKKTFTHWGDSISDYFDGVLGGKATVDMTFGNSKVKFDEVSVSLSVMEYKSKEDTIQLSGLKLAATSVDYESSSSFLQTLSFRSDLFINIFNIQKLKVDNLRYDVNADKSVFTVVPTDRNFLKDQGEGLYTFKPFTSPPEFDIKYKVDQFDIADLLRNFREDPVIDGKMKLDLHLNLIGATKKELLQSLNGHLSLYGNDLRLQGVDIDKLIERFKRSQRFTFVDVGAVVLMGPFGLLVSKGSDYTGMAIVDKDYVSNVYEFSSDYVFKNGLIRFDDVALSTELNRMAAGGTIDINKDSLDITVSLLNEAGCSIFSQNIAGSMINSEMGKIDAGKLILAPLTNLAKKTVGVDCEVIYEGKVKQPVKKEK